jgi:Domain of unknown function (DUF4160)
MPSVLPQLKGWRIVIYPNDHRPPHVHVVGVMQEARFELLMREERVELMSNIGFTLKQLQQIEAYLLNNLSHLCSEWRRIHES